jgi:ABC-2 type transport system permease protein
MFWQIFTFEIKYRLKRPATYIYFVTGFLLVSLFYFTGSTSASEKVYHNSPIVIAQWTASFSMIMMLVCSAVMGVPLYRDIDYNTKNYYLSYPITENGYFWGRYLGSFIFVVLISTSMIFGAWFGSIIGPFFGWVPPERMGPNHLVDYLQPFIFIGLPNLFLSSSIFFGLVAITRNVKIIYVGSILLLIAYFLARFLLRDIDNKTLVKLLDPFAVSTVDVTVRFYTPAEQNTLTVPITGMMLYNRILWSCVGFVILMATYFSFSFKRFFAGRADKYQVQEEGIKLKDYLAKLPVATVNFTGGYYRRIMLNLSKIEYLNIVKDIYFQAILIGGLIFLFLDCWIGDTTFGVSTLPLTVNLMVYKTYNYSIFIFIIIIFYTGETIHRDRTTHFNTINDALPTPDWVLYGSKLIGLLLLGLTLTSMPLVVGVIIQLLHGYTDFKFGIYFTELYAISFPQYIQMIMLSFVVHVLVNNKFAGHGVALLIWILMFLMRNNGDMNYNLLFYSYAPTYIWSDMDGIGHTGLGVFWFNFYWMLSAILLMIVSAMFYNRGVITSFKERWSIARQRFHGPVRYITAVFLLGFIATGAYTYYNVSYLNNYLTVRETESRQAEYEKKLKKYENIDQPKITHLEIFSDIFPAERRIVVKGLISIVNKTDKPINTIHLDGTGLSSYNVQYNNKDITATYPLIYKRGKYNWFRPENDTAKYRIYHLPAPLKAGDSAELEVNSVITYHGFTNDMSGTEIVHNGTFYDGGLPTIGYDADKELFSDEKRKKYKLPEKKDEYAPHGDPKGIRTLLFNKNADLITYDITVSTSADQMAIAPGYLTKQWKQNGRNYYHYVQKDPHIVLFYDVLSARYAVDHDAVTLYNKQPVNIDIYYHAEHSVNLPRFMAAYKDGLDYYSKVYGPFQFKQMRLLEFPKYRSFAQSFPNTVSFAEGFGWSSDFSNPDKFDYTYWVTAHELAHQWWGHQVVPNLTRGSNLISESLAEYTALLLSERKYGKDNMKRFLKQELDDYLRGRANEAKKENVFINCNRAYEWYNKGSLILYGLADLISKDTLNKALHEFRDAYAFKENPPFAGSDDLYRYIAKHVPDSVKYYLDDTWNKITLYENRVIEAKSTPTGKKNEYRIDMKVSTRKMYADSAGNEKPAAKMNDYIDIGVFAADSKDKNGRTQTNPLYLKKYKLTAGEHTISVIVKGEPPVRVGIDPYVKLIDRIPDDNVLDL